MRERDPRQHRDGRPRALKSCALAAGLLLMVLQPVPARERAPGESLGAGTFPVAAPPSATVPDPTRLAIHVNREEVEAGDERHDGSDGKPGDGNGQTEDSDGDTGTGSAADPEEEASEESTEDPGLY